MDDKDVLIALGSLEDKIGEELRIGQSTVSKRFKNNGPATLLMMFEALEGPGA